MDRDWHEEHRNLILKLRDFLPGFNEVRMNIWKGRKKKYNNDYGSPKVDFHDSKAMAEAINIASQALKGRSHDI